MYKHTTKLEKIKAKYRQLFQGQQENFLLIVGLFLVIGLPLAFVWNPIANKSEPKNEPQVLQAVEIPIPDEGGGNPPGGGDGGTPPPVGTPNTRNNYAETRPGVQVTLDILTNDSPRDNIPINRDSLSLHVNPSFGNVVINPDKTITYTPNPGVGVDDEVYDNFKYKICANNGACKTEDVTVRTAPVGVPNVRNDTASTLENTPVDINVLANDQPRDNIPLNLSTIRSTVPPTNGTVVKNPNNTFKYTPNPNFVGQDKFKYEVCATNGKCDDAEVTVNVTRNPFGPVNNQPPVATPDTVTTNGTPVNIPVLTNDFDPDGNLAPESVSVTPSTNPKGTVTPNPNGTVTYTPNPNATGTDTFTYTVKDDDGVTSNPAIVTVTITTPPVVSRPPVANDDSGTTALNTPITLNVSINDTDPDGDLVPNSVVAGTSPNGTITKNPANGELTFTPANNFTGTTSFEYTIADSTGKTDTATVTINVLPNQAPNAVNDTSTTKKDQSVIIPVLSNDTDPNNRPLGNVTILPNLGPSNGRVTVNPNGTVNYTPNSGYTGTDTFTYSVSNNLPNPLSDTAVVTITVTDTALPLAVNDSATTPRNQSTEISVLSNDVNPLGPVNSNLFDSIVRNPSNGTATFNRTTGNVVYVPNNGYSGTDSFTYRIKNADGESTATVNIDVTAPNKPDAKDDIANTGSNFPVVIPVLNNDLDVNNSLVKSTLTIENQPSKGTVSTNLDTGEITYTPNKDFTGTDTFVYEICNQASECDTATVTVNVTKNPKPTAVNDTAQTTPNNGVSIDVLKNDFDPSGIDPESLEITQNPSNGTVTIDKETDQVIYTPNPGFVGQDQFIYKITNEFGESSTAVVNVFVGVNPTRGGQVLGAREDLTLERTGGLDENLSNILIIIGLMLSMSFFGSLYFIKSKSS
jgi:hypothetical protein